MFTLGADCVCLASQLLLVFEGEVYFSLVQSVLKVLMMGEYFSSKLITAIIILVGFEV